MKKLYLVWFALSKIALIVIIMIIVDGSSHRLFIFWYITIFYCSFVTYFLLSVIFSMRIIEGGNLLTGGRMALPFKSSLLDTPRLQLQQVNASSMRRMIVNEGTLKGQNDEINETEYSRLSLWCCVYCCFSSFSSFNEHKSHLRTTVRLFPFLISLCCIVVFVRGELNNLLQKLQYISIICLIS